MSSLNSNVDVLVVGAGPVGLVAALVLAQNDVSIRIVDKLSSFDHIGHRAAGLQPRTLEVYKFLGVLDDFSKKGSFEGLNMRSYDTEGKLANKPAPRTKQIPTSEIPYPDLMMLGQSSNCAILRQHLFKLGVQVETSTELTAYTQDGDGVSATLNTSGNAETVRAKFLLGTDGAKGPTRRLAGINFIGETKEIRAVIGDVELTGFENEEEAESRTIMHNFPDTSKNRLMIHPIPKDPAAYFFFLVAASPTLDLKRCMEDRDFLQEQLRLISHRHELVVDKVRNLAEWRLNERVVDHLKIGRVFVAGDAAHCHSPTGGQGLNSGVLDAMNISWKLASVIARSSPLSLLDTYEEERLPVLREMLRLTADIATKMFKPANTSAPVWQRPLALRQLGVHYRWSGIVLDELRGAGDVTESTAGVEPEDVYGNNSNGERLRAGDRAPDARELVDAKGESTQLFNIFTTTCHTVVVFDTAYIKDVLATTRNYPKGSVRVIAVLSEGHGSLHAEVYTDSQGHAQRAYGAEAGVKIVIVRPDGVVGALLKSAEGTQKYFSKIFT